MKRKPLKITAFLLIFAALECALFALGCAALGQTDITPSRRAADHVRDAAKMVDAVSPLIAGPGSPVPDRRPVAMINTFNGNGADEYSRHPRWLDGTTRAQHDWLIGEVRKATGGDAMKRRIVKVALAAGALLMIETALFLVG